MEWWGWMILGAMLLGAELTFLDAAFYLVFLGIAAAITGLVLLSGVTLEARYHARFSRPTLREITQPWHGLSGWACR
jgi:membrane protein implicated in regulation of membrane protease activity